MVGGGAAGAGVYCAEAAATNDFGESAETLAESRGHASALDLLRAEPAGSRSGGGAEHP